MTKQIENSFFRYLSYRETFIKQFPTRTRLILSLIYPYLLIWVITVPTAYRFPKLGLFLATLIGLDLFLLYFNRGFLAYLFKVRDAEAVKIAQELLGDVKPIKNFTKAYEKVTKSRFQEWCSLNRKKANLKTVRKLERKVELKTPSRQWQSRVNVLIGFILITHPILVGTELTEVYLSIVNHAIDSIVSDHQPFNSLILLLFTGIVTLIILHFFKVFKNALQDPWKGQRNRRIQTLLSLRKSLKD